MSRGCVLSSREPTNCKLAVSTMGPYSMLSPPPSAGRSPAGAHPPTATLRPSASLARCALYRMGGTDGCIMAERLWGPVHLQVSYAQS